MSETPPESDTEVFLRRQRTKLLVLSAVLFFGGILIMVFLERLPLPARFGLGFVDLIAGAFLFVYVRQNSPRAPR
jgi:hypothetical protein